MNKLFKILFFCTAVFAFCASSALAASFDGITEPLAQASMGFTVSGKIDSIWVKEGEFVHKGDTLMNLIKTEEELRSRITKITAEDLSSVVSAKAKMDAYEKDLEATKKLFETSNSISAEQLWEKEMNFNVAKAEWEAAKVSKSKDSLEHRMARAQLLKQYLIAPFDGEIVSISKNRSESVEALESVIEIADVRTCRMTAYIIVNKTNKLKIGQSVNLQLNGSAKNRNKMGTIEFISSVVDKASLLRTVKVIFDNSNHSIEPGVTGKIILQ
ncbi:MAG: efflux RND transporter periplasmic adaptor subunit [Fibrobacter sp.]|nr:efflux RND transporter periplasmic adaptor subunit [Fibrobacter sp.]